MKLIATLASLVLLAAVILIPISQHGVMRTPELFGDARYVLISTGTHVADILWNDDTIFTFSGTVTDGTLHGELRQRAGLTTLNADGTLPGAIPFAWSQRISPKFFGSINFRGHDRKFCGAPTPEQLPCK